jgi:hypothetical protein
VKNALTIIFAAILTIVAARASDAPLPLIQLDNVPLSDALRQLARQAKMNVILDPRVSQVPYRDIKVSVRWENVTAREGLVALVDNYDLILVESVR